jgi:hypothetical protein
MTIVLQSVWQIQNRLTFCPGATRTDVGDGGSNSDFDPRVTLLGQLTLEELVQLGIEDTVRNELATLADSALLSGHIGGVECGKARNSSVGKLRRIFSIKWDELQVDFACGPAWRALRNSALWSALGCIYCESKGPERAFRETSSHSRLSLLVTYSDCRVHHIRNKTRMQARPMYHSNLSAYPRLQNFTESCLYGIW